MKFNKTDIAKAFGLYSGEKGTISYKVTLNDGTEFRAGNWDNTYDVDGNWVVPYTPPRMEKDVTQGKLRNKYK